MNERNFLEYLSGYREARPRGSKRFLFWVALAIHGAVLAALIVVPLARVERDVPEFESVATFLVRPPNAPPPPPPPPPPAPLRPRESSSRATRRRLDVTFMVPVFVPNTAGAEDFGGGDSGVPGGVDGGIPGGVASGIVGGLSG